MHIEHDLPQLSPGALAAFVRHRTGDGTAEVLAVSTFRRDTDGQITVEARWQPMGWRATPHTLQATVSEIARWFEEHHSEAHGAFSRGLELVGWTRKAARKNLNLNQPAMQSLLDARSVRELARLRSLTLPDPVLTLREKCNEKIAELLRVRAVLDAALLLHKDAR